MQISEERKISMIKNGDCMGEMIRINEKGMQMRINEDTE